MTAGIMSTVPGLREARAALISGYIWVSVAWLALPIDDALQHEGQVFARAENMVDSAGKAELLTLSALVAFLVGTVVIETARAMGRVGVRGITRGTDVARTLGAHATLAELRPYTSYEFMRADGSKLSRTSAKLEDLIRDQTAPCEVALRAAVQEVSDTPIVVTGGGWDYVTVSIDGRQFDFPLAPTPRRVLEEIDAVRARLAERAPKTAARCDQLHGEALFRLAVGPPCGALAIVLAVASASDGRWIDAAIIALLIGGGAALLVCHGLAAQRAVTHLTVDALRARDRSVDVAALTPIFRRYCERATHAAAAVSDLAPSGDPSRRADGVAGSNRDEHTSAGALDAGSRAGRRG